LNEYAKKVSYFFQCSLQATCCYHTTDVALAGVAGAGLQQGFLADAQCFTTAQLQRGLVALGSSVQLDDVVPRQFRFLSFELNARKPSMNFFKAAVQKLGERGIDPSQILHVGSRIERDIIPAKKVGMRTALFAGDKASLAATGEQLRDPQAKPDLLITEPGQITECVG
jgi:putative hydrolase of the HAD superfamily